ncbi:MAG: hypothetical protein GX066_09285 [Clostridiaceae bacterium]|nr:hypothetical protein [Clostridiaceae bacterium]
MKSIAGIFDYFKEAFHINRENKGLYSPQLVLIAMKFLMVLGIGIGLYTFIGREDFSQFIMGKIRFVHILPTLLSAGAVLVVIGFVYVILSHIVEAGLYNLYKKCINDGYFVQKDFWEGVRKYFFNFLFGDVLIFSAGIMFFPFYLFLGIITLGIGFAFIPIMVSLFLSMWKVSLVMNDSNLFDALRDSMHFAKAHFIPLSFLQLIHWSFVRVVGVSGGNTGSIFSWRKNADVVPSPLSPDMHFTQKRVEAILKIVRMAVAVAVPVLTVSYAIGMIVKMIFQVFFSLVLFIAYRDGFSRPQQKEVIF